ncbi:hypothetical protein Tco_1013946, partial [Tanacetum coccineum]
DPTEQTKIDNFMVQELDRTVNEWVVASKSTLQTYWKQDLGVAYPSIQCDQWRFTCKQ